VDTDFLNEVDDDGEAQEQADELHYHVTWQDPSDSDICIFHTNRVTIVEGFVQLDCDLIEIDGTFYKPNNSSFTLGGQIKIEGSYPNAVKAGSTDGTKKPESWEAIPQTFPSTLAMVMKEVKADTYVIERTKDEKTWEVRIRPKEVVV